MNFFHPPNRRKLSISKYINPFKIHHSQRKDKLTKTIIPQKEGKIIDNKINKERKESIKIFHNDITSKIFEYKLQFTFKMIVQYARVKIKKQYITPYITKIMESKRFNIMKDEEKPIYFCLYKINDIFLNKKTRLSVNFYECNLFYDENEYLMRFFRRYEYNVMMRYLLAFVYDKDSYSHCSKEEYRHKNKNVIKKFQYMVNNNYIYDNDLENISSERFFQMNLNRKSFPNPRKSINQKISPFFLKRKNLLFLYEYETSNKNKIRENLFKKIPKYYFIKDLPIEKVPNCIQNFYSLGYFMNKLIENYLFYRKYFFYKNKKPIDIISRKNSNIDNESLDNFDSKRKKENSDEEKTSSSLSDSYSAKFINEISLDSSSSDNEIFNKSIKKIRKRDSVFYTKDNKFKKKKREDNEISDIKNLIKTMENKKQKNVRREDRPSTSSSIKKRTKMKIMKSIFKPKIIEYFISHTDNFELKNIYDEKTNFIQRTFNKKFTKQYNINNGNNKNNDSFKQKEYIPKLFLNNIANDYSVSFHSKTKFVRSKKYFITSAGFHNMRRPMDKKNTDNYFSKIYKKKMHLSSKNNLHKFKFRNNFKYYNNFNFYNKNIDNDYYPHNFKSKGKIVKQKKISFSLIHNNHKISFKSTADFLIGIKKSNKNKRHQKELIREMMSNFGIIYQNRNKPKKKHDLLKNKHYQNIKKFQKNTFSSVSKNKINISKDNSMKNSIFFNKNDIYRDTIDLNGIFKHTKINSYKSFLK